MTKRHAPSYDRNRDPILEVLRKHFADRRKLLEIDSGDGPHAVCFVRRIGTEDDKLRFGTKLRF